VEVVQVTPPSIVMAFDTSASKSIPIVPALDGRPAPGFVVGKWTVDPPSVEVIGPASSVGRVTEALTEPVDLAGVRDRVTEDVTVGVLDPSLRVKTPRTASVTVQILPAPLEHKLRGRPVHLRNLAANLSAEAVPSAVDVTIRGSREALNRLEPDDVAAYVDLAGLGAGQYTLNVRADSSLEAGVTHIEPASVQVRVFRDKQ
jgi:YbbR domain-containing protein